MARAKSASVSVLNELHQMLAEYFILRIQSAKPDPNAPKEYDDDGNELPPFFIPLAASELQVMVTFLNNNKITATPDVEHLANLANEFKTDMQDIRSNRAKLITTANAADEMLSAVFN